MTDRLSDVRDSGMTERAVRTQGDILEVATAEFAANGYAGARVDEIAARTRTTKRMIYYYFGSKEGLYLAVLERVYAQIRRVERGIQIEELSPDEALRNARGGDLRPPHDARGVHPARQHREHPSRRASASVRDDPARERHGHHAARGGHRARGARRHLPRRRRCARRAHDDQRLRVLPCRQPPHVRRHLRSGHARPRAPGLASAAHRRHDRRDDDGSSQRPRRALTGVSPRLACAGARRRVRASAAARIAGANRSASKPSAHPDTEIAATSPPEGENTGLADAGRCRRRTPPPPRRARPVGCRRADAAARAGSMIVWGVQASRS